MIGRRRKTTDDDDGIGGVYSPEADLDAEREEAAPVLEPAATSAAPVVATPTERLTADDLPTPQAPEAQVAPPVPPLRADEVVAGPLDEMPVVTEPPAATPEPGGKGQAEPPAPPDIKPTISPAASTASTIVTGTSLAAEAARRKARRLAEAQAAAQPPEPEPVIARLPQIPDHYPDTDEDNPAPATENAGRIPYRLATLLSALWLLMTAAFAAGFFGVDGSAASLARLDTRDWLIVLAVAVAPLCVFWMFALVATRMREMRDATRRVTDIAVQLSAVTTESGQREFTPTAIRREVERATHALGALHAQLRAIETALATQAAAIDRAADQAELKAHSIRTSLSSERAALQQLVAAIEVDGTRALNAAEALEDQRRSLADPAGTVAHRTRELVEALEARTAEVHAAVDAAAARLNEAAENARQALTALSANQAQGQQQDMREALAALLAQVRNDIAHATREATQAIATAGQQRLPSKAEAERRSAQIDDLRKQIDLLRGVSAQARGQQSELPLDMPEEISVRRGAASPEEQARAVAAQPMSSTVAQVHPHDSSAHKTTAPLAADDSPAMRSVGHEMTTTAPRTGAAASPMAMPSAHPSPNRTPGQETPPARGKAGENRRNPPPSKGSTLDWEKLVRAANFPENEDDRATIEALYIVLKDPEVEQLLTTAEDTLSALADLGLYMEDFIPVLPPVSVWRHISEGKPLPPGQEFGGITDEVVIAKVRDAMTKDSNFSDLADQLCARYALLLARLFREATDVRHAIELADTRTGRAVMLVGRALGRFG